MGNEDDENPSNTRVQFRFQFGFRVGFEVSPYGGYISKATPTKTEIATERGKRKSNGNGEEENTKSNRRRWKRRRRSFGGAPSRFSSGGNSDKASGQVSDAIQVCLKALVLNHRRSSLLPGPPCSFSCSPHPITGMPKH